MATSLNARLAVSVAATVTNPLDLGTVVSSLSKTYSASLTDGDGAGEAEVLFHDTRTLAASASEDIDFSGSLTDAFGTTVAIASIKALIISAAVGNTNNVLVGGTGTTLTAVLAGATDEILVRPGATLALIAGAADATGYAVSAGSSDLLNIENSSSGSSVTYDIIVIGVAV